MVCVQLNLDVGVIRRHFFSRSGIVFLPRARTLSVCLSAAGKNAGALCTLSYIPSRSYGPDPDRGIGGHCSKVIELRWWYGQDAVKSA